MRTRDTCVENQSVGRPHTEGARDARDEKKNAPKTQPGQAQQHLVVYRVVSDRIGNDVPITIRSCMLLRLRGWQQYRQRFE